VSKKQVTIKMDARSAAAVRQALFESTKGFTYDETCVPPRVVEIRNVIRDLDTSIGEVVNG
jgi:hypothetical protein